jgi:hypothetical protein
MISTSNESHVVTSVDPLTEKHHVPGTQGQDHKINYEPQSVTAARAILAGEIPKNIFLDGVHNFANCWEGFVETVLQEDRERDREILMPDFTPGYLEAEFREALIGTDDPTLRLQAIDAAIQEAFVFLKNFEIRGPGPELRNMNLHDGFRRVCVQEIQSLLGEWDELTGGHDV